MELTWYDVLGVDADATADEVRAAYRRQARLHHPDLRTQAQGDDDEMFLLNEAWRVLGDPELRRQYDATVTTHREPVLVARHGFSIRPWIVILVVLAVIFVVTAYAAPH